MPVIGNVFHSMDVLSFFDIKGDDGHYDEHAYHAMLLEPDSPWWDLL